MKISIHAPLVFALLSAAVMNAHATTVVEAQSTSSAQAGQQPVSSIAHVLNGALVNNGNSAGPNGSSSAGPIGTGVTNAYADTTQLDGATLSTAYASVDLRTGSLRNYAEAGVANVSSVATAYSRFIETITFNNTSGSTLALDFYWEVDGSVVDQSGPLIGSQNIVGSLELQPNNSHPSAISLQGLPAGVLGGAQFNYGTFGGAGGSFFTFAPAGNDDAGAWSTTAIGNFAGLISATLLIPTGLSALDITAFLSLDCRSGAICDYGSTAAFRFGALPGQLSWTSESGVFLQAVPLPATAWLFISALIAAGTCARKGRSSTPMLNDLRQRSPQAVVRLN